jgi:chromosome segregation ATPase
MSDRHEQFCWWLGGFLRAQGVQGTPNLAALDAIRAELARALLTGQLAPDGGLSPRTIESLGGPWSGGERVSGKHRTVVGVDLGSSPGGSFIYDSAEQARKACERVGPLHGRVGVAYDEMQHRETVKAYDSRVKRESMPLTERVGMLELMSGNAAEDNKARVNDVSALNLRCNTISDKGHRLEARVNSLEDKPRGVLASAFDLLNNHVHKLEKRLYNLEQLPKAGETYRDAFTRGWDNAKDKIASLSEHQGKQAREQGKLEGRIGELEAQLKKAQDMAGSMHDDKERRLNRLEVPDTQRHIRDLQRWQSGVNTNLCDIKNKADALNDVATNLHKRLRDVEQAIGPIRAQGQLDAAFMAQRGHVAAGLASALNNQAMSAELNKHREQQKPRATPHDQSWNDNSSYNVDEFVSGIGNPEAKP